MPAPMVIGSRSPCRQCGAVVRWMFVPGVADGMRPYKDFEYLPEVLVLHDCPNYPGREGGASSEEGEIPSL